MASSLNGARWRRAAGAVLLVVSMFPMPGRAASSTFTVGDQSVVQVWAGNHSEVTIRTGNRPALQFDTDDEAVQVLRRPIAFGTPQNPLSVAIPLQNFKVRDATGAVSDATFAPEDFPYAPEFRSGQHDTVRIVTGEGSHVTVTLPPSVAILDARIRGTGQLAIDGYRGSTLFASSYGGRMVLGNVASAAFVQAMNGRLQIADASFDRLRVRGNSAALVFERTRARQVEVNSISGPIVWDNGTFDPGLARFESVSGPIALGVANGASVEARSGDGHVYGMWDKRTPLEARGDNEVSATVDGGGPVVNAVSTHGNVFLYDGSLSTRRIVPVDWRRIHGTLRPAEPAAAGFAPAAAPAFERRAGAFERFRALRAARANARTTPLRRRAPRRA